jgi:hypothetical protein
MTTVEDKPMELGRERAKAWIYSVINPLLEALNTQSVFLKRRNWTFRFSSENLEFIRPLQAYISYQGRPNWEDFVASNPGARERIENRDRQREELRKACNLAWHYLVDLEEFRQKVLMLLNEFRAEEPPASHRVSGLPDEEFHKLVAERIVNDIGDIPDHYGDHRFWSRFRDELIQFRRGPSFEQIERAGLDLSNANDQVAVELARVREELASNLDIPWAPYYDESLALPGR